MDSAVGLRGLDLAAVSRWRPSSVTRGARLLLSTALIVLLSVVLASPQGSAQSSLQLTVTAAASAGADTLFDDETFADSRAAIEAIFDGDAAAEREIILPPTVGAGSITLTVDQPSQVSFDDDTRSIGLQVRLALASDSIGAGSAGATVDALLLAQWADDASILPTISLGIHAGDASTYLNQTIASPSRLSLADAVPADAPAPEFTDAWVMVTSGGQLDLTPVSTPALGDPDPAIAPFYPEGFVAPDTTGAGFAGDLLLASVVGTDASGALGYPADQVIEIDGTVIGGLAALSGNFDDAELELEGTLAAAPNAIVGGFLQFVDDWTFTLDATSGTVDTSLAGAVGPVAESPLAGSLPNVEVEVLASVSGGVVAAEINGNFDDGHCDETDFDDLLGATSCWADALSLGWLDLSDVSVSAGLELPTDPGAVAGTATIAATFDPDANGTLPPFAIEVMLDHVTDGGETTTTASVTADPAGGLSLQQVAGFFSDQVPAGSTVAFPGQSTLALNEVTFETEISTTVEEADATFTVTAKATVFEALEAEVLVGLANSTADEPLILLGIKTNDVTLEEMFTGKIGAIEGSVAGRLPLPAVDYTTSFPLQDPLNYPVTISQDDLSEAAKEFYNQDVLELVVEAGVSVRGTADLTPLGSDFATAVGYPAELPPAGQPLAPLQLDYTGSIAGQFEWGGGDGASAQVDSFALSGSLQNTQIATPDWMGTVQATGLFASFEYDRAEASHTAEIRTTVTADLDGPDAVDGTENGENIAVTFELDAPSGGGFDFTMTGLLGMEWTGGDEPVGPGTWEDPFGTDLVIVDPTVIFEATSGPPESVAGTISGSVPFGDPERSLDVDASFALVDGEPEATLDLTLDASADPLTIGEMADGLSSLVPALSTHMPVVPTELDLIEISELEMSLVLADEPTLDGLGRVSVSLDGGDAVDFDLLLSANEADGGLIALKARPAAGSNIMVGDLNFGTDLGPLNSFELPDMIVVVASVDIETPSADLTDIARGFFADVHGCDPTDATCEFDFAVDAGPTVLASVPVPTEFGPATGALGVADDEPVVLKGALPLFGSTAEPLFGAQLPPMNPPGSPAWFQQGQLSFIVTPSSLTLEGAMTVRMDGEDLTFALSASVAQGSTSTSIVLAGDLSSDDGAWERPFGAPLTIKTVRLELGMDNGVVTIGFRGAIDVADKDLDVSLLVSINGGVPTLLGIRGASVEGFTIREIATFQTQVAALAAGGVAIDPDIVSDELPDLALKGIEFSYSAVDRPSLCLQAGIIMAGDLFLNASADAAGQQSDTCGGELPAARPEQSQFCIDNRTKGCLVSMRIEIAPTGVEGQASMPGFTLGADGIGDVFIMDDAFVDLQLDETDMFLELSGSAQVPGPAALGGGTFLEGFVALRMEPLGRSFAGDFRIFDLFYAHVQASFELTTGQATSPFGNGIANLQVSATMRSDFIGELANQAESYLKDIDQVVDVLVSIQSRILGLVGTHDPFGSIAQLERDLGQLGVTLPSEISAVISKMRDISNTYNHVAGKLRDAGLSLPSAPSGPTLLNLALNGYQPPSFPGLQIPFVPRTCTGVPSGSDCWITPPIPGWSYRACFPKPWGGSWCTTVSVPTIPGTPGVWIPSFCPGINQGGTCYAFGLVPFSLPRVPGLCNCTIESLVSDALSPLLKPILGDVLEIDPNSIGSIAQVVENLDRVFSASGGPIFAVTCAEFSADIAALRANNAVNMEVDFVAMGQPFEASFGFTFGANPADAGYQMVKSFIETLFTGGPISPVAVATCAGNEFDPTVELPSDLTLFAADAANPTAQITENSPLTIKGDFNSVDSPHTVQLRWDDRTTETISLPAGERTFTSRYLAIDDDPSGSPVDERLVRVTIINDATNGGAANSLRVPIANRAPEGLVVNFASIDVSEAEAVVVDGSFVDHGVGDSHTVEIDWGDGTTPDLIEFIADPTRNPAAARAFAPVEHVYPDDNPTGTSQDSYEVTVTVRDDDQGLVDFSQTIVVRNVEPTLYDSTGSVDVSFSVIEDDGTEREVALDDTGTIVEGQTVIVRGAFIDPGIEDTHRLFIDWGEDDPAEVIPSGSRGFEVRHQYLDDNPTGTAEDIFPIRLAVVDDDMSVELADLTSLTDSASIPSYATTWDLTVENDAPSHVRLEVNSPVIHENGIVQIRGTFFDRGIEDTYRLTIDWGDGSPTEIHNLVPVVDALSGTVVSPVREFVIDHQYLDDDPTSSSEDVYPITITFVDDDTGEAAQTDFGLTGDIAIYNPDGTPSLITDGAGNETVASRSVRLDALEILVQDAIPLVEFTLTPQRDGAPHIEEDDTVTFLGSFTDPGTLDAFTVEIDWGDGSAPLAYNVPADPARDPYAPIIIGPFTHQYLDDNPTTTTSDEYVVQLRVSDDDSLVGVLDDIVTVDNITPTLYDTAGDLQVEFVLVGEDGSEQALPIGSAQLLEGDTVIVRGQFSDVGSLDTHRLLLDWGEDGLRTVPLTSSGTFEERHTYLDDNPTATAADGFSISLAVLDDDMSAELPDLVARVPVPRYALGWDITVNNDVPNSLDLVLDRVVLNESDTLEIRGSFADTGIEDTYTITINWGDGTATETYTIRPETRANTGDVISAVRDFVLVHVYADDNPSGSPVDPNLISLSLVDDDLGEVATTELIEVRNVEPTLYNDSTLDMTFVVIEADGTERPLAFDDNAQIIEGQTVVVRGNFVDPGIQDTHRVFIDWGEDGPVELEPTGSRSFEGRHLYLDDNPTGTIADVFGITLAVVDDDMPIDLSDVAALPVEPDYAITWDLNVANEAPSAMVLEVDAPVVFEHGVVEIRGSFTDPGVEDTYTLTINWGDGTSTDVHELVPTIDPATRTIASPVREFVLHHRYIDDDPTTTSRDTYSIKMTFIDDDLGEALQQDYTLIADFSNRHPDGTAVNDNSSAAAASEQLEQLEIVVRNQVPTVEFTLTPQIEGQPRIAENDVATLIGSFVDPGTRDSFVVRIDWGDGTEPLVYEVAADPNRDHATPIVIGPFAHQYLDDNPTSSSVDQYVVQVDVTDDDSLTGSESHAVIIDDTRPTVDFHLTSQAVPGADVLENEPTSLRGVFTDPGTKDNFSIAVDWGDGTEPTRHFVYADPDRDPAHPLFIGPFDHRYADDGAYVVTVRVIDDDGLAGEPNAQVVIVGNSAPVIDAVHDVVAIEDQLTQISATFTDPGSAEDFVATIDWGDGTDVEPANVQVQPVDDLDPFTTPGFIQGAHAYAAPGIYEAEVCLTDSADAPPVCRGVTMVVVHGFLDFAIFGVQEASINAAGVAGDVGSEGAVEVGATTTVTGNAVSTAADVILRAGASTTGSIFAGQRATLEAQTVVGGSVDADVIRRDDTSLIEGEETAGEDATAFPTVSWMSFEVEAGVRNRDVTSDQELSPSDYGDVTIDAATLSLRSGTYRFQTLTLSDNSVLALDLDPDGDGVADPIVIEVVGSVVAATGTRIDIVSDVGSPEDVLVIAMGSISLGSDGEFIGTYVAVAEEVRLGRSATLTGGLYGQRAEIQDTAAVSVLAATDLWAEHIIRHQSTTEPSDPEQ